MSELLPIENRIPETTTQSPGVSNYWWPLHAGKSSSPQPQPVSQEVWPHHVYATWVCSNNHSLIAPNKQAIPQNP